MFYHTAAL